MQNVAMSDNRLLFRSTSEIRRTSICSPLLAELVGELRECEFMMIQQKLTEVLILGSVCSIMNDIASILH